MHIYSFILFDLCTDRLSSTRKIFWIFLLYLLSNLFKKSTNCSCFLLMAMYINFVICMVTYSSNTFRIPFIEPSQLLPVLMTTMMYHHESLQLLMVFSSLNRYRRMKSFGVSYLSCSMYFFQSVFWVIAFGQASFTFPTFYHML